MGQRGWASGEVGIDDGGDCVRLDEMVVELKQDLVGARGRAGGHPMVTSQLVQALRGRLGCDLAPDR